jgi:outer membrane protein OmpA-like peptidoglycan-associated protein
MTCPARINCKWRSAPLLVSAMSALLFFALAPSESQAQLLKHIKQKVAENTAKKVVEQQAKAESTVVKQTDKATDSALTKSNRGLDATMNRAGAAVDTGFNRSERALAGLLGGGDTPDQLRSELATGRAVLRDIAFAAGGSDILVSSDATLKRLAAAISALSGPYLIEGHVDATADVTSDQRLSEARASAVKARLISLGVAETRLFTIGAGSSRPLPGGGAGSARIEVARMQ